MRAKILCHVALFVNFAKGAGDFIQLVVPHDEDASLNGIGQHQIIHLSSVALAVAVDATNPLLDVHGIPGKVEVEQDACGGKSRGALHDRQDVCFVGKPRLAPFARRPNQTGQDALGTGLFAPNRCNRYSVFTGSEENPQVILFRDFNDDTFPEFRMDDPFAEREKTTMPW